ncbi:MAG: hypothetical protein VYA51_01035 [Planctomycetota bacterium]|nr:hypothetical protein [Planctomycetota bacterium]
MHCTNDQYRGEASSQSCLTLTSLLLLAACGAGGGSDAGSGTEIGASLGLSVTVCALTDLTASVVGNQTIIPAGTEISDLRYAATNTESASSSQSIGSASGEFAVRESAGAVVYQIDEDAVSEGASALGMLGTHETLLTMTSDEPVSGVLCVELTGSRSHPAATAWTMVDVGNNQISEYQTGELNITYQVPITVDGSFEVRTTTQTNASAQSEIHRSVSVTFTPAPAGPGGGPGLPGAPGDPLVEQLGFSVANESSVMRTETIRASVPFPQGRYRPADLDNMIVSGHQTAWAPLQLWPDGYVKVAQAQFTDVLDPGQVKYYTVSSGVPALTGPFARNAWVEQFSGSYSIGAEVRDTFHVPYRSFVAGQGELLQSSPLVETRRFRTYHEAVAAPGIGRDYLSSTYYVTEYRDMPFVVVDWVLGNDYLGADDPAGSADPNHYALGDADVRAAYFLTSGSTECLPYRAGSEGIEGAVVLSGDVAGRRVMQDTYIGDAQTRRYRFLLRFEPSGALSEDKLRWRRSANAMLEQPIFALATQYTWQQTGAAGLLGGPIPGPADSYARASAEYAAWNNNSWFGTWGRRGDIQLSSATGTPRNHPLSPELAHAIQGGNHRLLEKLEQMAWAQAMRPYHLYGLEVGAEQQILLWEGTPLLAVGGEHLGRSGLRDNDPYPAYRSMSVGQPRAHGWTPFDHEHWSADLLFDYWTISGDAWAKEELRQLGQSLKGLMRLQYYYTQYVQPTRAEGWCMQGFAQVYQATQDESIKDYAMRRVNEVVEPGRRKDHPSRALMFQSNYEPTGWPTPHEFFMPWQHGALLYGYLGAYLAFEEPALLEIANDVATTIDYSWVSNVSHPQHGWIQNGLRYYVPVTHNGAPISANHWDGLPNGALLGSSPLGGVHTFLVGGLHVLADLTSDPTVQSMALNYGGLLRGTIDDNLRWNKWFYCLPPHHVGP